MNSSDINQSVSKQSSTNQNENVLCMPVSRIPPRAPTARFSVSDSVAFFVAMFLFYARVDIGGLLFCNKQEKQTNSFCLCVRFGRASISDFANYKDICSVCVCVCVSKRALERVRVRRNCDDVSSEKFLLFDFFSFLFSQQKQPCNAHKK